jgi:ketosteroid isomerase-like protein
MESNDRSAPGPADVLRGIWAAWKAGDRAAVMEFVADEAVFAIYVPKDVLPFGGETSGRASISDRLQTILGQFDVLRYDGRLTKFENDTAHGQVEYLYRHKVTGEELDGVLRHIAQVRDGKVVHFKEYTDLERIRAFMRLIAQTAADKNL